MTPARSFIPAALAVLLLAAGCTENARVGPTYRRGVEALAAGSPMSAIPFLTQAVAAAPDDPKAHTMLAVAYAIAMEPRLAVRTAQGAPVGPNAPAVPGWRDIALGIAAVVRHQPDDAAGHFRRVLTADRAPDGARQTAGQWLSLALLLKGDPDEATESMQNWHSLEHNGTGPTALLWATLVQAYLGKAPRAREGLLSIAGCVGGPRRVTLPAASQVPDLDDQDLATAGIAAIRQDKLDDAERYFAALDARRPNTRDARVWLALLAAAEGNWGQTVERLKTACADGPPQSRALANQLLSVACALQNRPHAMIQHMLIGQRLRANGRAAPQMPAP